MKVISSTEQTTKRVKMNIEITKKKTKTKETNKQTKSTTDQEQAHHSVWECYPITEV